MIVGLFLRNYKCYGNINFFGFASSESDKLNVFIGPNGVGKSSILESINNVMNGVDVKEWSITIGQKTDRALISPVFLIKRNTDDENAKHLDAISDAFWKADFSIVHRKDYCKNFNEFRNSLKEHVKPDEYWLISIGRDGLGEIKLSPFHDQVINKTKRLGVSTAIVKKIYTQIFGKYKFVYIPVENKISDILDLQASEMQGLMDKTVVSEIKTLLDKKEHLVDGQRKSILGIINAKLDDYITKINEEMDESYAFEAKGNVKKNIRPNDITDVIIKEYFSVRPLTKDGKHIRDLSSGQQRLALIDIATVLLSTKNEKDKEIILAIDEPESSLETAIRFQSFLKLLDVSEKYGRQLFITTHWYGLLLKPANGYLHYVESKNLPGQTGETTHSKFPLNAIYDHRGSFPKSIEMKSYFDLVSSMLTLLKLPEHNWILCEGAEDASYLNLYLKELLPNVNILPFNGCGNIKKFFHYIKIPLSDSDELKAVNGKVYCLIDTDTKNLITVQGYKADKCVKFERLAIDIKTFNARTISVANPDATQAEIEDVLEGIIMWDVLEVLADDDPYLAEMLENYSLNNKAQYTGFSHGFPFLKRNNIHAHERIEELRTYLDSPGMKRMIADEYCSQAAHWEDLEPLPWMDEIIQHFSSKH